jgi:thiol-disulfide isomerase/thioredoxin
MKQLLLPFLLAAQLLTAAHAQSIDPHEIVRRGNRVEAVNAAVTHEQSSADAEFLAALAPPADDSHKWFITVITLDGCGPCKKLLADWQSAPALAAFAQPGNARASWAHLNVYAAEDETQTWRWQNIALKSYPTILLQPPRNGRFGSAATVVLQKSGYNGKPEELAAQLRAAIEKHAQKHRSNIAKQQSPGVVPLAENAGSEPLTFTSFEQKSPPFAPPAKPSVLPLPNLPSVDPLPLLPAIPPSVDPDAKPAPQPATPTPSDPAPAPVVPSPSVPKPADEKFPQHPEAVVIVDKLAESYSDARILSQIQRVITRLRAERPGILVKLLDVRDARQYPVVPRELPAVLTTNEGRLETKLDRTLLPIVAAEPPPFPWQAVAGLLANGFNWAGVAALGIWAVAMIRARRKAAGQKLLLDDGLVQHVRTLVEELLKGKSAA